MENATEQPFRNMSWQMSKVLDQLQKGYSNFYPSETWTPNVNLYETEIAYLVCVDLAGVDKEKIDLVVQDCHLVIRGTRAVPTMDDGARGAGEADAVAAVQHKRIRVHLMEIDHGAFSREVEVPADVDRDRITASYRNGMLWIEIPRTRG